MVFFLCASGPGSAKILRMTQNIGIERKLTTILSADAANYTGRMARDEVATVKALRQARGHIDTIIQQRGGRIANTSGDGLIAEFPSVVEAVGAAVAIQRKLNADPDGLPFRIGLHLGDVIVEGPDLLGDGVNLAARLQEIAPEGGIFASKQVIDHAQGRLAAEFRALSPTSLKHLPPGIAVYAVIADGVKQSIGLEEVLPQTSRAKTHTDADPAARATEEASDDASLSQYVWYRKHALIVGGGLVAIDILTGVGTFWSVWPCAALAYIVYRKRKHVPKHLLQDTGL